MEQNINCIGPNFIPVLKLYDTGLFSLPEYGELFKNRLRVGFCFLYLHTYVVEFEHANFQIGKWITDVANKYLFFVFWHTIKYVCSRFKETLKFADSN